MPVQDSDRSKKLIMNNRKARFEFEIVDTIEAGIVLQGTEVKSLRAGKVNMQDAYAVFPNKENDELFIIGMHISPYEQGNRENHDPLRKRKLLVHQREAVRLRSAVQEKGLTIVPLELYFSGPYIKVLLGVARGKKLHDKREATKERDVKRELQRMKF